jgi:hypothetical protein
MPHVIRIGSVPVSPRSSAAFFHATGTLMDFEIYMSIQGQIHSQVKDLPPGTILSSINNTAAKLH